MHQEPKSALKRAVLTFLPLLHELELTGRFSKPYLVLSRRGEGRWHGEYQQRPNLAQVYAAADRQLHEASAEFASSFFTKHPEYNAVAGFAEFGRSRFSNDKSRILRSAVRLLWQRHQTFDCDETAVDAIVEEFEEFVDRPTIRLRFQAQLLNYRMTASSLSLPENLTIRKLSEQEVSTLHGGSMQALGFLRPRFS